MVKVRTMVWCVVACLLFLSVSAHAAQGVINVNSATVEQLMMLPGIGEKTAKDIVAFRQANGPFKSIDDVTKVKGIGKKKLDKIRPNLALQGQNTYIPDPKQQKSVREESKKKT